MKKMLFILLGLLSVTAYAKPMVIVSILPQQVFVEKIAKDKVDVTLMVKPGNSPHSYEPKPSQMISISKADIYFSIDVEFEHTWLDRFKSQNRELKFVNISENVSKLGMAEHHHHEEHEKGFDPHTWTSPKNVKIMAKSIYETLVEIDPENESFYKSNLDDFIKEIEFTDTQIKDILKDIEPKSKFMVFHPSWGYFANEYSLIQIAVEVDGKKPKPKEIIAVINEAKEESVRVIFTQPEFSDKSAQIIAKEANVSVKKISPLNPNWSKNLIAMAKAIASE
ncbi:MAG: zinc ABC transporter substrate-binding protein [Campylobacterota bacterium]|nr:zinc ABC transporter substrate-binding protein [Campylobacterota bacterium]